jgi:hypothetical protein
VTPVERAAYQAELRRVAGRLGLPLCGDLEEPIIAHCKARLGQWIGAHRRPETLTDLVDLVAASLDLEIVEIHSEAHLDELLRRIPPAREPIMTRVAGELDDGTDGITIRRQRCEPWERPFLAVINCRGWHAYRRFFSKWHEVVHRLLEGQELRVAYRRTPAVDARREPEEVLVDRVAAALAFFPELFVPVLVEELECAGRLAFEVVDGTRTRIAPDASREATLLACVRHCPQPVHFVRCQIGYKREEERRLASPQMSLFPELDCPPQPKLRVTGTAWSPAGAELGVRFHQNMQVPESSIVTQAFHDPAGLPHAGIEPLEAWQTSASGPIGRGELEVEAMKVEDEVWALLHIGRAGC